MAFVPAVNVCEVELRYTWDGQNVENTLYFVAVTGFDETDMADLAGIVAGWWHDSVRPQQSEDVTLRELYLTDLNTNTSPTLTYTTGLPDAGSAAAPSLPNNNSFTISFRTGGRGRSSRGRNYWVGLLAGQVVASEVTEVHAASIKAAYDALFDALSESAWSWCIISRFHNLAPRTTALVQQVSTVVITDLTVDSQRRRLPGRGR